MDRTIETFAENLQTVTQLADHAVSRAVVDRSGNDAGLQVALLGLLSWTVAEAHCVAAGLRAPAPYGLAPNIRSMLECLIVARFLTDDGADATELESRLERYFRGVRKEQVKSRNALNEYPQLKKIFQVDDALATRERDELKLFEAALPADQRLKGHWSGLGLEAIAKAVGLGADYAVQYRLHSGVSHGNRPWDFVKLTSEGLGTPDLTSSKDLGFYIGFDALRYLTWMLTIALNANTVQLYQTEQKDLRQYADFAQSLEDLSNKGIIG